MPALPETNDVFDCRSLLTLVLIFAFQSQNILGKGWHVFFIAIPILLQVYFNAVLASLAYGAMHRLAVPYTIAASGALIGFIIIGMIINQIRMAMGRLMWLP
jgi:ACR3 family arsenite transporter